MKTAIQELIEWIGKERLESLGELTISEITAKATELLDKEKEQIKDAWEAGEMFGERVERDGMTTTQVLERRKEYLESYAGSKQL